MSDKKLKVLILEDDPSRMTAFRLRLNSTGRDVDLVHEETAAEAIKRLECGRFDLILLDHDLGGRTYVDHTNDKDDCGMRVAEWFSIRPERVRQHGPIVVHSLNGPAAQQMVELIGEASYVPFLWQRELWDKYLKFPNQ